MKSTTGIARRTEGDQMWVIQHIAVGSDIPISVFKGSELRVEGLAEYTQLQVINVARV